MEHLKNGYHGGGGCDRPRQQQQQPPARPARSVAQARHLLADCVPAWVAWSAMLSLLLFCAGHMFARRQLADMTTVAMIAHGILTGLLVGVRLDATDTDKEEEGSDRG